MTGKRKRFDVSEQTHYETVIVKTPRKNQSAPDRQDHLLTQWLFVAATAALAISMVGAAEQSPADTAGKNLYDSKCTRCHKHHDITVYEDMTWKRLLWKMKDKARLDNEEYGDLSDYLKNFREAAKSKKAR